MSEPIESKYLILYADDDQDDLLFIEEAFTQQTRNVQLITASDGEEVLTVLKELTTEPCLIILDVNMPKLNGKEALVRLRKYKQFEKIPVVLFTTSSMPHDETFAQRYNAGFITKPLNSRQMQHITEQFIEYCSDDIRPHIRKRPDS